MINYIRLVDNLFVVFLFSTCPLVRILCTQRQREKKLKQTSKIFNFSGYIKRVNIWLEHVKNMILMLLFHLDVRWLNSMFQMYKQTWYIFVCVLHNADDDTVSSQLTNFYNMYNTLIIYFKMFLRLFTRPNNKIV